MSVIPYRQALCEVPASDPTAGSSRLAYSISPDALILHLHDIDHVGMNAQVGEIQSETGLFLPLNVSTPHSYISSIMHGHSFTGLNILCTCPWFFGRTHMVRVAHEDALQGNACHKSLSCVRPPAHAVCPDRVNRNAPKPPASALHCGPTQSLSST